MKSVSVCISLTILVFILCSCGVTVTCWLPPVPDSADLLRVELTGPDHFVGLWPVTQPTVSGWEGLEKGFYRIHLIGYSATGMPVYEARSQFELDTYSIVEVRFGTINN